MQYYYISILLHCILVLLMGNSKFSLMMAIHILSKHVAGLHTDKVVFGLKYCTFSFSLYN